MSAPRTVSVPRLASAFLAAMLAALVACAMTATPAEAAAPKSVGAVNVSTGKLVLVKGKSYKVGAYVSPSTASKKLGYKSSKKSVATVSSKGTVKAKAYGKATITVWSKAKKSVKKKISVKVVKKSAYKKAKSIKVTGAKSIVPGKTLQLKGKVSPSNASNKNLKWKSSSTKVATVSAKGKVTAKKAGTVKITCWSATEKKAKKTVAIKVTASASKPAPAAPTEPAEPEPAIVAQGENGTCTWTLDENGLMAVAPTDGESGTPSGKPWLDPTDPDQVKSIKILPGVKISSLFALFQGCDKLESVDLSGLDVSGATDMNSMFENCSSLKSLVFPESFDTSGVTNMNSMFFRCTSLKSLALPESFKTSNVTEMDYMFSGCSQLELDCSGWDIAKVEFHGNFATNAPGVIEPATDGSRGECGTCKWSIDWNGLLTVRPTDGVSGELAPGSCALGDGSLCGQVKSAKVYPGVGGSDLSGLFAGLNNAESIDLRGLDVSKATDMSYMFFECNSLKSIEFPESFDTSKVTIMSSMFWGCSSLESIVFPKTFDTSSVTDLSGMFFNCSSLKSLGLPESFDTSSVTNIDSMFANCSQLELDCTGWDIDKVENRNSFATDAPGVIPPGKVVAQGENGTCTWTLDENGLLAIKPTDGVSGKLEHDSFDFWDDSLYVQIKSAKVYPGVGGSDLSELFAELNNVESVDLRGLDVSSATNMSDMFYHCSSLEVIVFPESFDTSSVTNIDGMFAGCSSLKALELPSSFDTSNVTDMSFLFYNCPSLESLTLPGSFDTSNVTNVKYMFYGCSSLETLNLPESFVTSNVTNMDLMFYNCSQLTLDCSGWDIDKVENRDNFATDAPGVKEPVWTN